LGADGQRGCRGGNEQRSASRRRQTRWVGGEPHSTLRAAPDWTNALARERECADQAVEQRARSGRCGSWTGAQDITDHYANPKGAKRYRHRAELAKRMPVLCIMRGYVQSLAIYPRPAFVPGARAPLTGVHRRSRRSRGPALWPTAQSAGSTRRRLDSAEAVNAGTTFASADKASARPFALWRGGTRDAAAACEPQGLDAQHEARSGEAAAD